MMDNSGKTRLSRKRCCYLHRLSSDTHIQRSSRPRLLTSHLRTVAVAHYFDIHVQLRALQEEAIKACAALEEEQKRNDKIREEQSRAAAAASAEMWAQHDKELRDAAIDLQRASDEAAQKAKDMQETLTLYHQQVQVAEGQAKEARSKWKKAVAQKSHLSLPLAALQDLQTRLRAALPPCDLTWRHVVVIGTSGLGKTTFVRQMLEELHYIVDEETDALRTCPSGVGTTADHDYFIDAKKIVLTDSAGTVRTNFASGKILAADLVIMFLTANCRAEEIHGEPLALTYRLRRSMQCVFILPKMDSWIGSIWKEPGQTPAGDEVIAHAHYCMAEDLVLKLEASVMESVESFDIEIAPDLQEFMTLDKSGKLEQLKRVATLRCFFSPKNYDIGNERFPYSLPFLAKDAMARERHALIDLICNK
eukprot:SM000021S06528  [mRNA]  locus=s21:989225:991102:- [translate_table: standard]